MSDSLQYAIGLETSTAQAAMERFNGTAGTLINRLNDTGSAAGRASAQGNSLAGTLTRLGTAVGFAALIKRGVEFNATMQDGEGAIAAIIQQFQGLNAEAAKAEAAKAMQQLIDLEPKAAGTLTDLLNGFSSTAAAAAGVGISVQQNIDLTGRFANALANLRMPVEQIGQEMRSVLTGNIGADSQLAKTLGITNEMVAAAKEAGTVYEMLVSKIGLLGDAADNVATRVSSFQSAIDKALGLIASGIFDVAVGQMGDLTTAINTNAETFRSMGAAVKVAANLILTAFSAVKTSVDLASEALAYFKVILAGEDLGTAVAAMQGLNQSRIDAAAAAEELAEAEKNAAAARKATNAVYVQASATANKAAGKSSSTNAVYVQASATANKAAGKSSYYDKTIAAQKELEALNRKAGQEELNTREKVASVQKELAAAAAAEAALRNGMGPNMLEILEAEKKRVQLQRELVDLTKQQAKEAEDAAKSAADRAAQQRQQAANMTQGRNDVLREIAQLKALASGRKKAADEIEREMRIEKDKQRLIALGQNPAVAERNARQKADLQDKADGKRRRIRGVQTADEGGPLSRGGALSNRNNDPLSRGGPLTKGGGIDGFGKRNENSLADDIRWSTAGGSIEQFMDNQGPRAITAPDIAGRANAVMSAVPKETPVVGAGPTPELAKLDAILAELTRIRTA